MRALNPRPRRRPRLLYLCPENPWRLDAGGPIRNYWFVRAFAERFDVDLVTARATDDVLPADFAGACAEIHGIPAPDRAARVLRALRPGGTLYTTGNVSAAMRAQVERMLRERRYDAISLDLAMIEALPASCNVPLIYNAHNCETALLRRRAARESTLLRRAATAVDARRLAPIERRLLERSVLVAACSNADIEDLALLAPAARAKSVVVPNGVDCARYASVATSRADGKTILVTGSFDWQPNRIGLRWFLREVVPVLARRSAPGELRIRVAGRMDPSLAAEIGAVPLTTASPNVPDMRDELAGAAIVAAPILASSGTRLRILEAWAAGRPVVTTPEGAFGLEDSSDAGPSMLVRSGAEPFADALLGLVRSTLQREELRRGGLAQAARYDWRRISGALLEAVDRGL
jgi:glycosyltransferase involved in cell wall biosynthesis